MLVYSITSGCSVLRVNKDLYPSIGFCVSLSWVSLYFWLYFLHFWVQLPFPLIFVSVLKQMLGLTDSVQSCRQTRRQSRGWCREEHAKGALEPLFEDAQIRVQMHWICYLKLHFFIAVCGFHNTQISLQHQNFISASAPVLYWLTSSVHFFFRNLLYYSFNIYCYTIHSSNSLKSTISLAWMLIHYYHRGCPRLPYLIHQPYFIYFTC